MARRKPETVNEANDIRQPERVVSREAKCHSVQSLVPHPGRIWAV
jgi:hypothetical protein